MTSHKLKPDSPIQTRNAVVLIPTFNESDNIERLIKTLFDLYPDIHILVMDDNSPDGTSAIVRSLQPERPNLMLLERIHNPGFAASYREGLQQVLAEQWCHAIIMMDADFSHNPSEISNLLDKLSDKDVTVGSRYIHKGSVRNWNLRRRMLSRIGNVYVRAVLGLNIRDVTSGFLCMRREALENISIEKSSSEGYAFQVELKYLLIRSGNRIAEHPISFDERREGKSKMDAGKIWESFWMPWRIRSHA